MLVGEQAGSLRNNSPGESGMLLGLLVQAEQCSLGGEVSREGREHLCGGSEGRTGIQQGHKNLGREVCGGGGGVCHRAVGGLADFLSPLTSWRRKWITGVEVSIALFPTMKTEP